MNTESIGERFVDTGAEWSADEIEKYTRGSQKREDYSSLLNFTYSCQMINISGGDKDIIELNKRLEEKSDVLIELPPYVIHAGQWGALYEGIQKIIESNVGDEEKLEKILLNVYGKWQIMLAREEFEKNTKNALERQEKSFVNGADWDEEKIQEYRESAAFASDYTFLLDMYLKFKVNIEFNKNADQKIFLELNNFLENHFDELMDIPVHALDNSFSWSTLYSICYKLSEKLPENQRTVVDSLAFMFDQNYEFEWDKKQR